MLTKELMYTKDRLNDAGYYWLRIQDDGLDILETIAYVSDQCGCFWVDAGALRISLDELQERYSDCEVYWAKVPRANIPLISACGENRPPSKGE